jgi:NAD(P)-dependent dehydrogenase (short-subunit alcohol dehydrogenase family)
MPDKKVIVMAGGAGQLGSQFCRAVAESGAIVIVADRALDAAGKIANEIVSMGMYAESALLDITDSGSVDSLISSLHERHGRIDGVVNNAYPRNRNYGRKLESVTYEDFCENVSMHLGGYFLVAQKFSLYFSSRGGGTIINMSSIYGSVAPRFGIYDGTAMTMPVEYAAIKAAINHLTRYMAQYFKQQGVRVNSLSPGGILNNQPQQFLDAYNALCSKLGMLNPSDVTGTLLFLLSDDSRGITGQDIVVDDGFSL